MSLSNEKFFRQLAVKQDLQLATVRKNEWAKTQKAERVKKWITYYRRNWEQYVEDVLQIQLYPVQKYKIHMMSVADVYWDVSTRGCAKTFLCGLGAIIAFNLYPHSEIVITASTIGQASIMVEKKIRDEIIKKLSPYLLYLYSNGYITISKGGANDSFAYIVENKLNGSTIMVAVCSDAARGLRSTINIYEEARLLKKTMVDSVFEPMGHNRSAPYLLKPEYKTSRWVETAKSIYLTSTRYEWEWFIRSYRKAVVRQFSKSKECYVTVAEDFYTAIWEGSRTWADYRKMKRELSDADFLMEGLNATQGMTEDSWFNLKQFVDNQEISEAFVPPTDNQVFTDTKPKFRIKDSMNEVRIIGVDFAFANKTGKTGVDNDNTIIECFAGIWKGNHFERRLEYITQWEASDSTGAMWRVRELFQDYNADYICMDGRSGGESLFNMVTENKEHPKRGQAWDSRGLTVSDRTDYHLVSQAKIDDYRHRTIDPYAIPCIFPVIGSTELNSSGWLSLRHQLDLGNIKFLKSLQTRRDELVDSGEFFKLQSEDLAETLAPYGETDLLIQEAVQLNVEIKQDRPILKEDRNKTKDRVVVLSYVNMIFDKIENAWNKQLQEKDDFDIDDLELVF